MTMPAVTLGVWAMVYALLYTLKRPQRSSKSGGDDTGGDWGSCDGGDSDGGSCD